MVLSFELFSLLLFSAIYLFYKRLVDPKLIPRDVPQDEVKEEYDFVIVGGGISGCVLANRLSEYWSVFLIEAGGDEHPLSYTPLLNYKSDQDWNYTTVPQKTVCHDTDGKCSFRRAKVLGGMSIYSMVHLRGNRRDFDQASSSLGINWTYQEVLPFYIKSENATQLNIYQSTKYRGFQGPLKVEYAKYKPPILKSFMEAGKEIGLKQRDYNGKIQENSIDYAQLNLDGASRQSAAKAYLYPIKNRKNLAIIKHSYVYKINIDGRRAEGVEYIRDGKKYSVRARKEVILSAGPLNTAKLLMLSGIGPKEELEKHRIPVVLDLSVGKCLKNQIGIQINYELNKGVILTPKIWKTKKAILEFAMNKSGPLTTNGIGAIAFNGDEKSPTSPSISYEFYTKCNGCNKQNADKKMMSLMVIGQHPKSKGSVKLKNTDPNEELLINPNYLADESDYTTLIEGINVAITFMNTKAMKKYSPTINMDDQPKCISLDKKEHIKCLMKYYVIPQHRHICTAKLGREDDPEAVVSSTLIVIGIPNLRVVGSSIFPEQPTGIPYTTTYMVAERCAYFIFSKYHRKKNNLRIL